MSWLARLHDTRSAWSGPLTSSSPELARILSDAPASRAGVTVSGDTAMTLPAFWAAVALISNDIAKLPLVLYKRGDNGAKTPFVDHQLYRLLHDAPNEEMSSFTCRRTLQAHVLVWGNAYAEIVRDAAGRVAALWPLTPNRVQPFRDRRDPLGSLQYAVSNPDGTTTILAARDVLHIPGLGFDGTLGYSVVAKARESLGLGLALQQFGATFFGNGSTFGGIVSSTRPLGPQEKKDITANLRNLHQGVDRAHRFVLLEGGLTYEKLGVPPDDGQFLESRLFQVSEIARWFNLSPHKLADFSRATFSNIEEANIDHVVSCLQPWTVCWEQEIARKLIAPLERRSQFVKHNVRALLRGNQTARADFYSKMFSVGAFSINDIRDLEDLNPIGPEGDQHFIPANMLPADAPVPPPAPAPAPTGSDPSPAVARALEQVTTAIARVEAAQAEARTLLTQTEAALVAARSEQATPAQIDMLARQVQDGQALAQQFTLRLGELTTERQQLQDALAAEAEATARALLDAQAARTEAETARAAQAAREAELAAAVSAREAAETARGAAEAAMQAAETRAAAAEQRAATLGGERETADQARADAVQAAEAARAEADRVAADLAAREMELAAATVREQQARDAHTTADAALRQELAARERDVADLTIQIALLTEAKVEQGQALTTVQAALTALETERDAIRQTVRTQDEALAMAQASAAASARRAEARDLAEQTRVAAIVAAHRALLVDIMRRMLERETDRARRAQTTPEKLRAWIETFYPQHEELCVTALLPAIRVHLAWMGRNEDPEGLTRQLVRAYLEESKRQISAVADGDSEELASSLYGLVERWQRERVATIADALMQKEIDRATEPRAGRD